MFGDSMPWTTPQHGHCSCHLPSQQFLRTPQPLFVESVAASGLATGTSRLLYFPHEQFWCSSMWPQLSVEVPPGSANAQADGTSTIHDTAAPCSQHVWAALASPSWAESLSDFSPQDGSGPHYNGCSTNHLLSEPVMMLWLSYLYKQCQFWDKKVRNTKISRLIVLSIIL